MHVVSKVNGRTLIPPFPVPNMSPEQCLIIRTGNKVIWWPGLPMETHGGCIPDNTGIRSNNGPQRCHQPTIFAEPARLGQWTHGPPYAHRLPFEACALPPNEFIMFLD